MRNARIALVLATLIGCAAEPPPVTMSRSAMTAERLLALVQTAGTNVKGVNNTWEFTFDGIAMACVWDVNADRMRFFAPIAELAQLNPEHLARALDANFHSALDARYATSRGILYAAFIHPLSPLSSAEARSGLRQVAALVKSFGTAYSSGAFEYRLGQ